MITSHDTIIFSDGNLGRILNSGFVNAGHHEFEVGSKV